MTRGPIVTLQGGRRLRQELKAGGVDLANLKNVHMEAARTVTGVAKPATPKRTGRLAGSVRPGATQTAGIIRAGKQSVPYAQPIHWGWPARNIPAQPWLVDAAHDTEPQWVEHYWRELDRVLSNLAGGPR